MSIQSPTLILPTTSKRWNLKVLLLCHMLIAILGTTLFVPATAGFWTAIDVFFFKLINGSLDGHPRWQLFWALANHKLADWVEDLAFILFFVFYVKSAKPSLKTKKVAELIFVVLYSALIIYFINRMLFRETLCIPRESPTLLIDSSVKLSDHITWLKIKDDSTKSFPGDHGTTALLFGAFMSYLGGKRLGILASLYAIFLCLPRLFTGAHWLSDVIVGSGSIALFFVSWAFCSPFGPWCISIIEKFLLTLSRLKKNYGSI